jgi:hypothetical protein
VQYKASAPLIGEMPIASRQIVASADTIRFTDDLS